MVSELAGEGSMPLPAPASHVELRRVHLQRQIHRRSLLRRGVTNLKSDNASRIHSFASFNLWRSFNVAAKILKRRAGPGATVGSGGGFKASKQESSCNLSRVLINHRFKASNCTSWSRSMKNSSKRVLVDVVVFAVFSRSSQSRSAESSSAELVLAISSPQRRTRNKKQSITPIPKLPINTATSAAIMIVIPNLGTNDVYVAYLPLAHVFEFDTEILVMAGGASIGYSSTLSLIDTSNKVKSIVETSNKQSIVELDFELRLASFYLFFCLKFELVFDGHLYLSEDDKRGDVVVVASKEIDIEEILGCKALVIVEDTNVVLAVLNDVMEDRYNVLITLVNQFAANEFYCSYNGKRFKSLRVRLKNMSKEVEDSEMQEKLAAKCRLLEEWLSFFLFNAFECWIPEVAFAPFENMEYGEAYRKHDTKSYY
nr:long chain acyl-CoA synthetase 8 [Ipomoea trifida]